MDDSICKDHDWELFDCLSLWKSRNRINLNSGPLFEILVKHWISYLMSAFRENIPIEVEVIEIHVLSRQNLELVILLPSRQRFTSVERMIHSDRHESPTTLPESMLYI
ncbi:hypothetical protein H5410_047117 [Solanum commersonii]|uniref:Ycf2 N-terminal domain-containing protein n=1 Tax=Solanum commersonii TaxID=4109 RepID=A0A9J5XE78_SOLCO|nr:hypothetical protein H5410_047117 [Solanum commersonii]